MQIGEKARVLIATPASGSLLTSDYVRSLFSLQRSNHALEKGIDFRLQIGAFSILDKARNVAASTVYNDPDLTHLLFIDADQGFRPELIFDMIAFDKPVVSAVIPKRHVDLRSLHSKARQIEDVDEFISKSVQFVEPGIVREADGRFRVVQGFIRVRHIGTGIMLIQRGAIERLAELPDIVAQKGARGIPDMVDGDYVQCFRPVLRDSNTPMGEDISFCHRWTIDCGGEIWANITHSVAHVGVNAFTGAYFDQFR